MCSMVRHVEVGAENENKPKPSRGEAPRPQSVYTKHIRLYIGFNRAKYYVNGGYAL